MRKVKTCRAGDLVSLPALPLSVSDGYDLDDATIRVRIFEGAAPGTTAIDYVWEGADTDNLELAEGELTITILAADWPESWAFAVRKFDFFVEVQVEFDGAGGPETKLDHAVIEVRPQAILPPAILPPA